MKKETQLTLPGFKQRKKKKGAVWGRPRIHKHSGGAHKKREPLAAARGLAEESHDGFLGVQAQRLRHGSHEAAGKPVGLVIEGAVLEALERAQRNLGEAGEFVE